MKYLIILLLSLLSAQAFAFDWQGHRGARGLYPENTIEGMKEALKFPVTTLELDVIISQDNQVVVSHEPWMNEEICLHPEGKPIKGKNFNLFKMSYSEIIRFDCGSKAHPRFKDQSRASVGKPLLVSLIREIEPLLKNMNRQNLSYNIEIKSTVEDEKDGFQPDIARFSELVIKTALEHLSKERLTIQSFDWRVLKYLHQKHPEIKLVALREDAYQPEELLKELGFSPTVFSPDFKLLKKEDVDFFHQKGIKVIPWTINFVEEMKAIKLMGVDGIITDYPNLIEKVEGITCEKGYNLFEGKCVDVPAHALPADHNPGWICKSGYVQKRSHCDEMKIPAHAHLNTDGKNWECDQGFKRYRGSCKKE